MELFGIAFGMLVAAGSVGLVLARLSHRRRRRLEAATHNFCLWLIEHAAEVRAGNAEYQGEPITLQTRFDPRRFVAPSFLNRVVQMHTLAVGRLLSDLVGFGEPMAQLTPQATDQIHCLLAAHDYPVGTAVRVVDFGAPGARRYDIQFDDRPPLDEDDWRCASHGIVLLIQRDIINPLQGLTIDFEDGRFLFHGAPSAAV
ncbi:MAG TPA: hypothetical protein VGZ22_22375 [Isosphaeraceae bacterium]|jgi:Fe-S cluster assembly iron-binding protein IscA|nr:hypothetical protein [Isosphaeraceae bacterium]